MNAITFSPRPGHLIVLYPKGHADEFLHEVSGSDGINSSSLQTEVFANSDLTGNSGSTPRRFFDEMPMF